MAASFSSADCAPSNANAARLAGLAAFVGRRGLAEVPHVAVDILGIPVVGVLQNLSVEAALDVVHHNAPDTLHDPGPVGH
jgi:hypothetical protein